MKKQISILSFLLTFAILATGLPACAKQAPQTPESRHVATVLSGSDFQCPDGHEAGAVLVTEILEKIREAGNSTADAVLFCGDYSGSVGNFDDTEAGIAKLKEIVLAEVGTPEERQLFIKGNHDAHREDGSIAASGPHDEENGAYGVFVINEEEYGWFGDDEAEAARCALQLESYLNEKLEAHYQGPVFVLSHIPLHMTERTVIDGGGKHARYYFNLLNDAARRGLNIIHLFGHNHSNAWDQYVGGASIYIPAGSEVALASESGTSSDHETMYFTSLNAGYIGYVNEVLSDTALTMMVFDIYTDKVVLSRYSKDGLHTLGNAGAYCNEDERALLGEGVLTARVESPVTIQLREPNGDFLIPVSGVPFIQRVMNQKTQYEVRLSGTETVSLDLSRCLGEGDWKVTLEGDAVASADGKTVTFEKRGTVLVRAEDGARHAYASFGIVKVNETQAGAKTYLQLKSVSELADGQQLILSAGNLSILTGEQQTSTGSTPYHGLAAKGYGVTDNPGLIPFTENEWTLRAAAGGWLLCRAEGQLTLTPNGDGPCDLTLTDAGSVFEITENDGQFLLRTAQGQGLYTEGARLFLGSTSAAASFTLFAPYPG